MKKLLIAGVVVGTALGFAPVASAAHDPFGFLCGFASNEDPQVEGSETGEIDGGPLVIKDETTAGVETGTITCTVQVNAATHAGADSACTVTGPNTPAVVAAAATCTYSAGPTDNVYLCTQVDIDGHATLYWNDSNDPLVEGSWSLTNDANCALATSVET